MPRKIRQLIADLKKAGFMDRGGKGNRITLSGKEGADAQRYQEREVRENIERSKAKR